MMDHMFLFIMISTIFISQLVDFLSFICCKTQKKWLSVASQCSLKSLVHNILHAMRRDRKSFFFQWALTRRAARIESLSRD